MWGWYYGIGCANFQVKSHKSIVKSHKSIVTSRTVKRKSIKSRQTHTPLKTTSARPREAHLKVSPSKTPNSDQKKIKSERVRHDCHILLHLVTCSHARFPVSSQLISSHFFLAISTHGSQSTLVVTRYHICMKYSYFLAI